MRLPGKRVYVCGRLRGITARRLHHLAKTAQFSLIRRSASADAIVLAHNSVAIAVSDAGETSPPSRYAADAQFISERQFRSLLGLAIPQAACDRSYSEIQVANLSGLRPPQVRTLSLYDVLSPENDRFSYRDVVTARVVAKMVASGVNLASVIGAANALEQQGRGLSEVRLAEAPWGGVVQVLEGALAEIDGQLLLHLDDRPLGADQVFARAEACEADGDLEEASRWYELAARLDRQDAVIPFNLGNVLGELGRSHEAEIAYRQALARDPAMADAWYNLGVILEAAGKWDDAVSSYKQAASVEPTYANALHNAASLLMRRRMFHEALPLLERLVSLSPTKETKKLAHLCRLEIRQASARA